MRLTKSVREQIIDNSLIQSGIVEREKKLSETIVELAEDCRMHSFDGTQSYNKMLSTTDEIKKLIEGLPKKASHVSFSLHTSNNINVSFGGKVVYMYYSGSFKNSRYGTVKSDKNIEYITGFCEKTFFKISPDSRLLLKADHKFSKRFECIHNNMEDLKSERIKLITQLEAALSTYSNTNRLLKDWPDMKPMVPFPPEKSVNHLPAVQVTELNKLIGLPVK